MSKNNRLTFFIFLALILGIVLGYVLNVQSFDTYNTKITNADNLAKSTEVRIGAIKDTTSVQYAQLKTVKAEALKTEEKMRKSERKSWNRLLY